MPVDVSLLLFMKPEDMIDTRVPLPEALRDLAEDIHSRLLRAADYVDRLQKDGWDCQVGMYDVMCVPPDEVTEDAATKRLESLQIDPEDFDIHEFDDEDDDDDEDYSQPTASIPSNSGDSQSGSSSG